MYVSFPFYLRTISLIYDVTSKFTYIVEIQDTLLAQLVSFKDLLITGWLAEKEASSLNLLFALSLSLLELGKIELIHFFVKYGLEWIFSDVGPCEWIGDLIWMMTSCQN